MTGLAIPILSLILTVGIVGAQAMLPAPFLPDLARDFGVSLAEVGTALGGYGVATALSALLLAPRLDRFRRGHVLAGALLGLAGALAVVGLAPGLPVFAGGILLTGLAAGILLPGAYAAAGDLAPPDRRAAVMGRVLLGWSVALVLGVPLGSALGDTLGWRGVFLCLGGVAALIGLLVLRLPEQRVAGTVRPSLRAALQVPGVWPLLVVCWCLMTAFYGGFTYLGSHVRSITGSGAGAAGLLVFAYGIGFALAAGQARWIDRWGPGRMLSMAGAAAAALYLCMPVAAHEGAALLVVMALFGGSQHMMLNSTVSWLGSRSPERRGSIMAINSAVTYAGLTCGTAGLGWVNQAAGFPTVAACAAALVLAAAGIGLWQDRQDRVVA